jgi:calmodulin
MAESLPVCNHLPAVQTELLRILFYRCDKNGEGTITIDALDFIMTSLGETEAEFHVMIDEINGKQRINFDEFLEMMSRQLYRKTFRSIDTNGTGFISETILRQWLTRFDESLTEEEIDEIVDDADIEDENQIDFEEFVSIMTGTQ